MVSGLVLFVLGCALTFAALWFFVIKRGDEVRLQEIKDRAQQQVIDRITELERQSAVVSKLVEEALVKEVTHHSFPEADLLIVKTGPLYTLTESELMRLSGLLQAHQTESLASNADPAIETVLANIMGRVRRDVASFQSFGLVVVPRELLGEKGD